VRHTPVNNSDQYILTLASDSIAKATKPGQFVHIMVSDSLAMRRPISIMSVDVENATFDLLPQIDNVPIFGNHKLESCFCVCYSSAVISVPTPPSVKTSKSTA
jgi:hypothetical protein